MAGCRNRKGNCAPRSGNYWPRPRRRMLLKTRTTGRSAGRRATRRVAAARDPAEEDSGGATGVGGARAAVGGEGRKAARRSATGEARGQRSNYIATGKQKHDEYRQPCSRGPLARNATRVDRMKRKLQTRAGRAIYATRKTIVEPVFGQIKQARGFRQFLLRGLAKVQGEWALVCLTHNILKLHRLCSA